MGGGNDCGSDREAARVGLNSQLREVVLATQAQPHAHCFLLPVDVLNLATDYHAFVDPRNGTVCLEQLLSRTRSCFYTSVHEFRREYEQMLANALAYNSPGHGRHAHKPVIGWAQELLDACVQELARRPQLAAFEQRLKETSRADSDGKDSAQASPRSNKMSTSTACPLSSMEALVAACEMAAEQEGLEQGDMQQYYLGMVAAGACYELAQGEEGMGEAGSGSGSGSGVCGHEGDQQVTRMKRQGSGGEAVPGGGRGKAGSRAAAAAAALDSAPKYRRHKSKVYIRPNKVVYLPTTFMEENFDPSSLPVNCEMIVETNGGVQPDRHRVTIKAVPRQGLATMYCMTNVMKFQQQFLNWQILNWTKMDEQHIKIHLQSPDGCAKGTRMDSEEADVAPPAPIACHKRKGGRDMHDMGATCEQEAEDAMDLDEAGGAAVGTQGAEQRLAAYLQDQHHQHANQHNHHNHQRHGRGAATSPRGARGGQRRGAAKAAVNTSEGSGGGAAGEVGSGTSSPFHHDQDLLEGGYGGAQTSGSGEDGCGDREVRSSDGGGGGSGGSAEGTAQRSHELELSPAHSGGSDSGGTGTAVQPGGSQGQGGQKAVHQQQQQQQQQQVEVQQQFEGQQVQQAAQHAQQAQQAPHLLPQQLHMPYPQPLPFGPPGFGFGAWPLWGPGAPPPPLMVPGPGGPMPLDAAGMPMPPMPPMPLGCGTFETAQQQSQRYATAMMLLQQLPVTAAAQPSALPGVLAGLGCLPIPPLRTTLMNAASLPAGTDGCNSSNSCGTVALPPMASSSAYKRCKTTSGSSAEAATAGSMAAAPTGMVPPLCPGATPAAIASDVELSCLSMPGLLPPDVVAMATALAAAAAKGDVAASGRGEQEMGMEGLVPQAAQLQHAFTM